MKRRRGLTGCDLGSRGKVYMPPLVLGVRRTVRVHMMDWCTDPTSLTAGKRRHPRRRLRRLGLNSAQSYRDDRMRRARAKISEFEKTFSELGPVPAPYGDLLKAVKGAEERYVKDMVEHGDADPFQEYGNSLFTEMKRKIQGKLDGARLSGYEVRSDEIERLPQGQQKAAFTELLRAVQRERSAMFKPLRDRLYEKL